MNYKLERKSKMNKKNLKFVIAFIIFFIMIFGLLVSQIGSFAVVAEKPIYINLGKSKNVNGKNIGYGINDPTESTGNYIWQINQYNSNNVNDKVTNARNLYCIKAEYGKSWVSNGGKETNIVEYNLSYDLEQQREEILKKLVDSSDENTVIKNLLTPEKGAYNQILWILDNAYIPGTTNKEEYLKKNHEAYVRQQQEIHRLEDLIEKFRYKKNKAAFAKSKQKYLDHMDKIEDSSSDTSQMKAVFTCARKGGKQVLDVEDLSVGYDKVLSKVSFQLLQGQRMAIVGPNGIGKSTLIKTLVKELPAISGSFKFGHQIDVGYFNQESAQMKSNKNVLDELWDIDPDATQTQIRNTLASFLFTQDEVFKEVNDLSGGERVRLALAKLMLEHDNVLLLDEPTNHLDIPAKEALESALEKYDGTILFVSHDRMFLKKMATRVLEMDSVGKIYDLNYEEYLDKKASNELIESVAKVEKEVKPQTVSFTDLKAIKNRVAKLEVLLDEAEQDLEAMRELRYEPEYYQDYRKMEELDAKIDDKHNEIAALMKEWEEKMAMME